MHRTLIRRFMPKICSPGGGFVIPARADYFPFLESLQKALSVEVGEVGVAALEYCGSTIETVGGAL